jgi:hypothetical protein
MRNAEPANDSNNQTTQTTEHGHYEHADPYRDATAEFVGFDVTHDDTPGIAQLVELKEGQRRHVECQGEQKKGEHQRRGMGEGKAQPVGGTGVGATRRYIPSILIRKKVHLMGKQCTFDDSTTFSTALSRPFTVLSPVLGK